MKIPFREIKKGSFFRIKGKALYQRGKPDSDMGQIVTGNRIGDFRNDTCGLSYDTMVTPVNARIVEDY